MLGAAARAVARRRAVLTHCFCLGAAGAVARECSQRSGLQLRQRAAGRRGEWTRLELWLPEGFSFFYFWCVLANV